MTTEATYSPARPAQSPTHGLSLGPVRLAVRDLDTVRRYWTEVIGLADHGADPDNARIARLGADGGRVLVELEHAPDARLAAPNAAGLFHVALLVPERADLADSIARIVGAGQRIDGAADHLVSEALYVTDPEGNGIELYWDRPADTWTWGADGLSMATLPLDLDAIVALLDRSRPVPSHMPRGTVVGHVHLKAVEVGANEHWYGSVLGLDTVVNMPSAAFMSADGYHHHLGMNTWASHAGPRAAAGDAGLVRYDILLPAGAHADLAARIERSGNEHGLVDGHLAVRDPSGVLLRLVSRG